ncbi:MAG TPA: glutaminyl-peptide cyclotransferase [Bacteroidales bacterium]|nr:glutaminyl-peptide cyclotransferase [Bacteroidales bacterium]
MNFIIYFLTILLFTWTVSCSGRPEKKTVNEVPSATASVEETALKLIKMVSPEENTGFKLKEPVKIILEVVNKNRMPDSVQIFFNSKRVTTLKSEPWVYSVSSDLTVTTGRKSIKAVPFREGRSQSPVSRSMVFYSDIVPRKIGYKVVHSYPHDVHAFTQGLVFDNGTLFESTGQMNESTLREVQLNTGKVIRQHNLVSSLFGEGITVYKNRIYQVTWQNKVGFIYEKSTFNQINKIYYPTEGWGMTTVGDKIIMSDGTNILYTYEPEMFTSVSSIEVYDNEKKVDALNELEYINGEIWANIWMTDLIARIDPSSGKVLAYVNLENILPKSERSPETDVLNGIAYDQAGGRIFVTGKNWPKLYEIRLAE